MDSNIDPSLRKEEYTFFGTPEEFEKVVQGFQSAIGGVLTPYPGEVQFALEDEPAGYPARNMQGGILWVISPHFSAEASLRYRLARGGKTILAFHDHAAYQEYYPLKQEFLAFLGRDGWLEPLAPVKPPAQVVTEPQGDAAGGDRWADEDRRYWTEVHKQATESGHVTKYLSARELSKSTYYDKVKQYGLKLKK